MPRPTPSTRRMCINQAMPYHAGPSQVQLRHKHTFSIKPKCKCLCAGPSQTLFDLQEISAEIQERTSHLSGVFIAIMGCIVNGPGEIADADFGNVGGVPGKIDLYVGKTVVKRGIAMEHATIVLIELIREWL
ncbi:unnamed protein product [Lupinus luteus]|uniref:IspG C-terminal domain-containing protein n=1 Tax=Lupinus luteus TaxID=3873 RepID=A0AAV1W2B1_LUPLU